MGELVHPAYDLATAAAPVTNLICQHSWIQSFLPLTPHKNVKDKRCSEWSDQSPIDWCLYSILIKWSIEAFAFLQTYHNAFLIRGGEKWMRWRRGSDPSTESEERNIWKRDRRGIEIRRRGRILKQRGFDKEQAEKAGGCTCCWTNADSSWL